MTWKWENGSLWNAAAAEGTEMCCESLWLSAVGNSELMFQQRVFTDTSVGEKLTKRCFRGFPIPLVGQTTVNKITVDSK